MTLLDDIRKAVLASPPDLETALLLCVVLGHKQGVQKLVEWATNEQQGYPEPLDLPPYRLIKNTLMGRILIDRGFGNWLPKADQSVRNLLDLDDDTLDNMETISIYQSVGQLAVMPDDGSMIREIGRRAEEVVSSKLKNAVCDNVYVKVPVGAYHGIREVVRGKVIAFALQLESQFHEQHLEEEVPSPQSRETVKRVMENLQISSSNGVINVNFNTGGGTQTVIQTTTIDQTMTIGSLINDLRELGIGDEDIEALEEFVDEDERYEAEVRDWFDRWILPVMAKFYTAGVSVSLQVIAAIIAQIIMIKYGVNIGLGSALPIP